MITQIRNPISGKLSGYQGLSNDTKPTDNAKNGWNFLELDTLNVFRYDKNNDGWRKIGNLKGTGIQILGEYETIGELESAHPTGNQGDAYLVNGVLYIWDIDNNEWFSVGDSLTFANEIINARGGQSTLSERLDVDKSELLTQVSILSEEKADKLKVATLDKSLSDFQKTLASANINQELKPTVSGYGSVSLPKTAANRQVSAVVKGMTLKNELNYNPETWAEWTKPAGVVGDSTGLELTSDGVSIIQTTSVFIPKATTKYVVLYYVVSSTLSANRFGIGSGFTGSAVSIGQTVGNQKTVITSQAIPTAFKFFTAPDTLGNKIKVNLARIYELPPGSEIETDANTMTADQLAQKYPYIQGDGTKSTISAIRNKSVGKNLWDEKVANWILGKGLGSDGIEVSGSTLAYSPIYIKIKPNTQYMISTISTINTHRVVFYDANKLFISRLENANTFFTTPSNAYYIRYTNYTATGALIPVNMQIEQGTVATPYEPYTESTQYFTAKDSNGNIVELRSLPNGTKDEIRVGETKLIKRVSNEVVLNGNKNWSAPYDLGTVYRIGLPANQIGDNIKDTGGSRAFINKQELLAYNFYAGNYEHHYIGGAGTLYVYLNKSKIDIQTGATILDKFKAYLNQYPVTLTYQLATPIETPIEVSGTLMSYPSGTVYIEPVVADAGVYNGGITILNQGLPIKELEKIVKVDFMTGMETELNVSQAVIASDKKSFTHPNLVKNDIIFFTYFYDKEGTEPELTVEYYDSRYIITDTSNGKVYQWKISSTNGAPTIVLTEA